MIMKRRLVMLGCMLASVVVLGGVGKPLQVHAATPLFMESDLEWTMNSLQDYDSNNNGVLDESEAEKVKDLNISSDEAAEKLPNFTKLETLHCFAMTAGAGVSELDLSKNVELVELMVEQNQLSKLDVSHNPKLMYLMCGSNQLSKLDVSHNPKLIELSCTNNKLTSLDVSKNTKLASLICGGNKLTNLNLGKNSRLCFLGCYDNKIGTLDVSKNVRLQLISCQGNNIKKLALGKNKELVDVKCDSSVKLQGLVKGCMVHRRN